MPGTSAREMTVDLCKQNQIPSCRHHIYC